MACFKYGFSKFELGFNREQVLTWSVLITALASLGWVRTGFNIVCFKYGFSKFGLDFNREQVLTWSVLDTALASLGLVLIENRL
jgi:hypothetical protein